MVPFIVFFNGQILLLAAVFTLTDNQGERFLEFNDDYEHRNDIFTAYLKTFDFTQYKNKYTFDTTSGCIVYVVGLIYLNIIIVSFIIALVYQTYSNITLYKKEADLKTLAEMLLELYQFTSAIQGE
jgi:hypothetical protein